MEFKKDTIVEVWEDKPKSGMWTCGPNPCWVRVTHKPTGSSVTVYSGPNSQNQARNGAFTALGLLLELFGTEPCSFPENGPVGENHHG